MKRRAVANIDASSYSRTIGPHLEHDLYDFQVEDEPNGVIFRAPLKDHTWACRVLMVGVVHDIDPADPLMVRTR